MGGKKTEPFVKNENSYAEDSFTGFDDMVAYVKSLLPKGKDTPDNTKITSKQILDKISSMKSAYGDKVVTPDFIKQQIDDWVKSGKPIPEFIQSGSAPILTIAGGIGSAPLYKIKETSKPNPKPDPVPPKPKPDPEPEIPIGKPRGTGMIKQALPEGLQAKLMPFKKLNYETKFAPFNALYGGGASKNTGDAIGKSAAVIGGGIGAGLLDVANNALVNQFLINQANKFGGGKIQFNKSTGKYEVIKGKNDLTPEEMMAQNKNAVEMAKIASNEKIANLKLEEILTRIAANNAKKVKKVNQKPQQGSGQAQVKTNPYNPQTEPAEYGAWNIDNNK